MKLALVLVFSLALPVGAFAGDALSGEGIAALLTEATLYGTDHGQPVEQVFLKSGVTYYSLPNSQQQGSWKIQGNKYCSAWPPNSSFTCYAVLNDGASVTFVATDGKRSVMSLTK